MSNLNFDHHQFEGSRAFPVSAATGISFEDYRSMQTATHAAPATAFVPPFALNDKKLQKVLLFRAWRYVHPSAAPPEEINREEINQAATAKATHRYAICKTASPIQRDIMDKRIAAVRRAGGFLQLHAAIAFRSWRLGMDSVSVAASVGMTPQAVRQALWRMRHTAKKLGYDVGRAGWTAGMRRPSGPKLETLRLRVEALAQFNAGKTLSEIATDVYGYPAGSNNGRCRVRTVLRAAGANVPTKTTRSRSPRYSINLKQVVAAYQSGDSVAKIAVGLGYQGRHGITPLRLALKRAGVYPRSK